MTPSGEPPFRPGRAPARVPRDLGVVVIARNEGDRLVRCLASLPAGLPVVYADSASTDGSPERARRLGAEVVELDVSTRPPNQPRGRNAGLARLLELAPDLRYVFFVDGDCELVPGFLEAARDALEADPGAAAACGRRRELRPRATVYNLLVDMEWNTPVGPSREFGGDVLLRVEALRELGSPGAAPQGQQGSGPYEESMISGEDHELAFRLHAAGWRIHRIPADMTRHDVALERLGAWWSRHARGGYAYAHGAALHRGEPEFRRERVRNMLVWGLLVPLAAGLGLPFTGGLSGALLGLLAWPWWRLYRWRTRFLGDPGRDAALYASFLTLGKLAEALGVLRCWLGLLRRRGFRYVEYKDYQRPARGDRDAA